MVCILLDSNQGQGASSGSTTGNQAINSIPQAREDGNFNQRPVSRRGRSPQKNEPTKRGDWEEMLGGVGSSKTKFPSHTSPKEAPTQADLTSNFKFDRP